VLRSVPSFACAAYFNSNRQVPGPVEAAAAASSQRANELHEARRQGAREMRAAIAEQLRERAAHVYVGLGASERRMATVRRLFRMPEEQHLWMHVQLALAASAHSFTTPYCTTGSRQRDSCAVWG